MASGVSSAAGENKMQHTTSTCLPKILSFISWGASVWVGGNCGGNTRGDSASREAASPPLKCRFVHSRETPEGGFLKGNYTSGDYAAVQNGN